jgi:hypothetical protein
VIACRYGLCPSPLEVRPPILTLQNTRFISWMPDFKYTKKTVHNNDLAIVNYIQDHQPAQYGLLHKTVPHMSKNSLTERLRVLRKQGYIGRVPNGRGHYLYTWYRSVAK